MKAQSSLENKIGFSPILNTKITLYQNNKCALSYMSNVLDVELSTILKTLKNAISAITEIKNQAIADNNQLFLNTQLNKFTDEIKELRAFYVEKIKETSIADVNVEAQLDTLLQDSVEEVAKNVQASSLLKIDQGFSDKLNEKINAYGVVKVNLQALYEDSRTPANILQESIFAVAAALADVGVEVNNENSHYFRHSNARNNYNTEAEQLWRMYEDKVGSSEKSVGNKIENSSVSQTLNTNKTATSTYQSKQPLCQPDSSNEQCKNRTGFTRILSENLSLLLKLSDKYTIGTAFGGGDCFFDALAQGLNELQNTHQHTDKSLRMKCHSYYSANKALVDGWNEKDWGNTVKKDEYYLIQYTKEEMDKCLNQQPPVWGRPKIEGVILCRQLKIAGIHLIEINIDPGNNKPIATHFIITIDGETQLDDEKDIPEYGEKYPTIIVSQNDLHFIPLLNKNNFHNNKRDININSDSNTPSYPQIFQTNHKVKPEMVVDAQFEYELGELLQPMAPPQRISTVTAQPLATTTFTNAQAGTSTKFWTRTKIVVAVGAVGLTLGVGAIGAVAHASTHAATVVQTATSAAPEMLRAASHAVSQTASHTVSNVASNAATHVASNAATHVVSNAATHVASNAASHVVSNAASHVASHTASHAISTFNIPLPWIPSTLHLESVHGGFNSVSELATATGSSAVIECSIVSSNKLTVSKNEDAAELQYMHGENSEFNNSQASPFVKSFLEKSYFLRDANQAEFVNHVLAFANALLRSGKPDSLLMGESMNFPIPNKILLFVHPDKHQNHNLTRAQVEILSKAKQLIDDARQRYLQHLSTRSVADVSLAVRKMFDDVKLSDIKDVNFNNLLKWQKKYYYDIINNHNIFLFENFRALVTQYSNISLYIVRYSMEYYPQWILDNCSHIEDELKNIYNTVQKSVFNENRKFELFELLFRIFQCDNETNFLAKVITQISSENSAFENGRNRTLAIEGGVGMVSLGFMLATTLTGPFTWPIAVSLLVMVAATGIQMGLTVAVHEAKKKDRKVMYETIYQGLADDKQVIDQVIENEMHIYIEGKKRNEAIIPVIESCSKRLLASRQQYLLIKEKSRAEEGFCRIVDILQSTVFAEEKLKQQRLERFQRIKALCPASDQVSTRSMITNGFLVSQPLSSANEPQLLEAALTRGVLIKKA